MSVGLACEMAHERWLKPTSHAPGSRPSGFPVITASDWATPQVPQAVQHTSESPPRLLCPEHSVSLRCPEAPALSVPTLQPASTPTALQPSCCACPRWLPRQPASGAFSGRPKPSYMHGVCCDT